MPSISTSPSPVASPLNQASAITVLTGPHPIDGHSWDGNWRDLSHVEDYIIEGWSEGFLVGALIIMACVTVANMRRRVALHKLILTEQLLAMSHGTFCFMAFSGYGWYLSSTATLLYLSWFVHNIVAWMKIKPFFTEASSSLFRPRTNMWVRRVYLLTLACTLPFIVWQIADNFRYFNNINDLYVRVRPYEPLMRDPWWIFTCLALFHVIRKCYGTGTFELIQRSPRFGILLVAIVLAMVFTAMDIVASEVSSFGGADGINPYWKLSLVFKCLTDTIMLDDFKTELKKLGIRRLERDEKRRHSMALVLEKGEQEKMEEGRREVEYRDVLDEERSDAAVANNTGRKKAAKEVVGRASMKITPLPSLGGYNFLARVGKKKANAEEVPDRQVLDRTTTHERVRNARRSLGVRIDGDDE